MPSIAAVVIGAGEYQEPRLASAPHAGTDAAAFARALAGLGATDVSLFLDGQATRTALGSRLRKLAKSPPEADLLLVWFSGLAFSLDGAAFLACHDTQADDLEETAIPLADLLAALKAAKRAVLLLDPRDGVPADPFGTKAAGKAARKVPNLALLASRSDGESSQVSGALKAGVWAHQVLEAFAGKASLALEEGGLLTLASLQAHLEREVPRTLRATFREGPEQTPAAFAPAGRVVLAELAGVVPAEQAVADPRLMPLKRGVLRGETRGRIKSLGGFRKFHRIPDRPDAARRFVGDVAGPDVQADVDHFYATIRELLGYKRRDVEGSADRGSGYVRTPDFEYSISVEADPDDPQSVVFRREVGGIRAPEVVLGKEFQQVFGDQFDALVFEFTRPFDLEAWVDGIEESMPAGVKLRTAPDCSSCEVTVPGFMGMVRVTRDGVEIRGTKTPTSKALVEAFLGFQDRFKGRPGVEELPLLPGPKA
ncbi:MAG: hypothetical protein K2W96_20670 [Gemmataceae bacterium]|nr:hypothetical protein [Gemmataceae bacterium]